MLKIGSHCVTDTAENQQVLELDDNCSFAIGERLATVHTLLQSSSRKATRIDWTLIHGTKPVGPAGISILHSLRTSLINPFIHVIAVDGTKKAPLHDSPPCVGIARWSHVVCLPRPSSFSIAGWVPISSLTGNPPRSEAAPSWDVLIWVGLESLRILRV